MNWGHTVHTGLGDRDTSTPIRRTIVHYESIVELRRELARVATAESCPVRPCPVPVERRHSACALSVDTGTAVLYTSWVVYYRLNNRKPTESVDSTYGSWNGGTKRTSKAPMLVR